MVTIGQEFMSGFTNDETLTVDHIYTEKMFSVKVGNKDRSIICTMNNGEGQLSMVHISNEDRKLTKVQEEIPWLN